MSDRKSEGGHKTEKGQRMRRWEVGLGWGQGDGDKRPEGQGVGVRREKKEDKSC